MSCKSLHKREERRKKMTKRKSPEGLDVCLTNKGMAYYLACKHGLCPKIKGGYDTTKFDEFWNEFEVALLEKQNERYCGRQDSDDDRSNSNSVSDLGKAYTSARKGVAIAGALFCIQLALLALQLILAFFLN